jgi:hypothetical protein
MARSLARGCRTADQQDARVRVEMRQLKQGIAPLTNCSSANGTLSVRFT